ncbi:thymidine phosphorylase [Pseudomonas sp. 148P]|uniref:Thymidine phosphorylase n=1 Tax=Pseudomonas ulcerans TaxID=3115852 RepID=A0ABU7HXN9_9PSED|nr:MULTISPECIES: thymidine phosphorylase [unclassified Pseudomonas]MEE1922141.1 thymidine phosphorylase [Pseudomonas sp. 147P]MEE1936308.1 thymidine phosphorylase [Pseudomonas sp. 148P]
MVWLPQEVIRRKRDGKVLDDADIRRFVSGITDFSISEGQVAAFAMAVLLKGLQVGERIALATAMRDSGRVLGWNLPGPVVDKHSTGGIGDLVSLPLAPLLAACGCYVPMISGRGLGHTGGTLDKLDSIPGYDSQPDMARLREVVANVGCAIIGQTNDLAPADKRLYAIRDVTGTVESIDLIIASILSKKLAAGLDVLLIDVKVGNGAFMAQASDAAALAESIVAVANGAGVRTRALITDMSQPLARSAGNALEVEEAVALLRGEVRSQRLWDVTLALAEQTLLCAGLASSAELAREQLLAAWKSGAALQRFARMVEALGGPADLVERPENHLPAAPVVIPVMAPQAGIVQRIDTREIGLAVVGLGGGRRNPQDPIDPAVGLSQLCFPGEAVGANRPLALVHARDLEQAERAAAAVQAAYSIATLPYEAPALISGLCLEPA